MEVMKSVGDGIDIILKEMSVKDSESFYRLYFEDELTIQDQKTNEEHMNPVQFTEHILSLCEELYSIRTVENEHIIIGDCALHHWNQEEKKIEIGGSLLPKYWGKGIMSAAFELLTGLAKEKYQVNVLVAKTEITNLKALKFAEKLGFQKMSNDGDIITLEKRIL
ncbi:GNAT family N-acetyltransferase [Sphingobacterium multivorum]|uniref:GNAT family N-acetyltransferase n=1 Tax=Sphingobacterium multivorum TaxID=28454 RepID=UPI0028ACA272|nr:GNAT family N-acetyltransferase [Sphingobacterium multivorum]